MSSSHPLPPSLYLSIFTYLLILTQLTRARGGEAWDTPNIVIQNNEWTKIPDEIYDGSSDQYPQPPSPYTDDWKKNDTKIIVLIAAFRETRCKDTLFNLFTKSAHPDRIYIAIVQQNRPNEDEDCIYTYCRRMDSELIEPLNQFKDIKDEEWNNENCPHFDQLKITRMTDQEAKGPVYARALQAELVDDEEFCMQIDAHSDAAENWDVLMLSEWGRCDNEYAVMSTYPSNIKDIGKNSNKHWEMPHLCDAAILGMGQVRNARARAAANLQRPVIAPLWAAGLSFSRCHAEKRVPNDVHLPHVFNGEEYSRGARLWTHGYDFYTPSRAYIGTWYQGQKGNKGSWSVNREEQKASHNRMGTLLQFPGSDQSEEAINKLGFYGIGEQRTLDQYFEFSGVNTREHTVDMRDKCVRHWVKWEDEGIKDEIMAMSQHVVDHEKQGKEVGIEVPLGGNNMIYEELQEIEQLLMKQVHPEEGETSWLFIVWLLTTAVCIIGLGGWMYRQKVDKICSKVIKKYADKDHIV